MYASCGCFSIGCNYLTNTLPFPTNGTIALLCVDYLSGQVGEDIFDNFGKTIQMKAKHLLIALLLFLSCNIYAQTTITGKVVKVTDGDTFNLLTKEKKQIRVRVYGIDAPERSQSFGNASRKYLASMIAGKQVTAFVTKTDRYGRKIAKVKTDSINDISFEMIKSGMAWHYSYYDNTKVYAEAEKAARAAKKGLWILPDPVNPYLYRKNR